MSRLRLSKYILLFVAAGTLSSCVSQPTAPEVHGPLEKVFLADFDGVWKAAHTVIKYPLANENQETGVMETEFIKSMDGWQPPEIYKNPSPGQRYKIIARVVRGRVGKKPSIKVSIEKKVELQRDFFAEPEPLLSDGLEEKMMLYRMERELVIDAAINKAMANNPTPPAQ